MAWAPETDSLRDEVAQLRNEMQEMRTESARLEGLVYRKHGEAFQWLMNASLIGLLVAGVVGSVARALQR